MIGTKSVVGARNQSQLADPRRGIGSSDGIEKWKIMRSRVWRVRRVWRIGEVVTLSSQPFEVREIVGALLEAPVPSRMWLEFEGVISG